MANGIGAHRACVAWLYTVLATSMLGACSRQADSEQVTESRKPPQAGHLMNPAKTAAHIVGARVAAVAGNQKAAEGHVIAIAHDMRRSARLSDPSRPINGDSGRSAARVFRHEALDLPKRTRTSWAATESDPSHQAYGSAEQKNNLNPFAVETESNNG